MLEIEEYKELLNKRQKTKEEFRRFKTIEGMIIRNSMNYPTQGTAADMTKVAMCITYDNLLEKGIEYVNLDIAGLINEVHDELVLEARDDFAEECAELVKNAMLEAGQMFCDRVPMKVSPVISNIWEK